MPIDVDAARNFLYRDARLLERHLAATLLDNASPAPVLAALSAFRTEDGGWGHALEPDLRGPDSQVSAAMSALGVFAQIRATQDPLINETCDWLTSVTLADGSVPQALPSAANYPAAPWMRPNNSGFLTFLTAAHLWDLGADHAWLAPATAWCWEQIETTELTGYQAVFALSFLDAVPDVPRATFAVERFRKQLASDGSIPVSGGVEGERVTPLVLSPTPGTPSRALFSAEMIEDELDALEANQLDDGGWDFHFLHWCPGQTVEWRGITTLTALLTLRANGR